MTSPAGWTRPFEDPISLPDGRKLVTLEDAATFIQQLPEAEHAHEHWQTAVEMLIRAAEREQAWLLFAQMAVMTALNHGAPAAAPGPRRKPAKRYNIIPAARRET